MDDIRMHFGFHQHPKTIKLVRKLGYEGVFHLQQLWLWAAKYRHSGTLSKMNQEDISIAAGWSGEADFVAGLREAGFLDKLKNGLYRLHNWKKRQPWVVGFPERSQQAKINAKHKRTKGGNKLPLAEFDIPVSGKGADGIADGTTPSPSPSPLPSPPPNPSPNLKKKTLSGKPDDVPYQEIIDDLNSYQDSHYKPGTESIRKLIRGRWAEGYHLEDFRYVHAVKFSNWQGEKINGLPALRYFRPSTLYNASKFPGYREEKFNHEYIANQFGGQELQNIKHIASWLKKKGGEIEGSGTKSPWPSADKPVARIPERSK